MNLLKVLPKVIWEERVAIPHAQNPIGYIYL